MSIAAAGQWAAKRLGRAAVIDFVRSRSHEARLAYPRMLENVLSEVGGRLAWAGSIDQELIGHDLGHFEDILVSEYPSAEVCLEALAERRGWQPESILSEIVSHIAEPWPSFVSPLAAFAFGAVRLLGAGSQIGREQDSEPKLQALRHEIRKDLWLDDEQLRTLIADTGDGPVVMVNLLHFRELARYQPDQEAPEGRTGRQAYAHYGRVTVPMIARLGGRLRWMGNRMRCLSEDHDDRWAQVAIVQYPSRAAFLRMVSSQSYHRGTPHRDAGLERTRLLACTSHAEFY